MLTETENVSKFEMVDLIGNINKVLASRDTDRGACKSYNYYFERAGSLNKSVYEVLCEVEKVLTYNDLRDIFSDVSGLRTKDRISGKLLDFNPRYVKTTEGIYLWHPSTLERIKQNENIQHTDNIFIVNKKVFDSLIRIDDSSLNNTDEDFTKIRGDFVNLIKEALAINATDAHFYFAPGASNVYKLCYRIHGDLYEIKSFSQTLGRAFVAAIINFAKECTPSLKIDDRKKPQDARIFIAEDELDLRLSFLPKENMIDVDIVIRLLKKGTIEDTSLENLGYSELHCKMLRRVIQRTKGLVIVSGPVGSGKSKSVNMLLSTVKGTKSVYTCEDPIEYSLPNGRQFQILEWEDANNSKVLRTGFADFARAFKRHDPNVIFIGELRDKETVNAAMHLSKTGSLVFATMHISRGTMIPEVLINDYHVDRNSIADNLLLGVNQVLVKVLDKCKVESTSELPDWYDDLRYAGKDEIIAKLKGQTVYAPNPHGCPGCTIIKDDRVLSVGYSGRTVVAEAFEFRPEHFKDGEMSSYAFEEKFSNIPNILDDAVAKILSGNLDYDAVRKIL